MKNILPILLLFAAVHCFAQQQENCRDVVRLRNGSLLRGKITEYQIGGELAMTTWNGAQIRLPESSVKNIKQHCRDEKKTPLSQRTYSFRESGWYHASRVETLMGQSGLGIGLQHSSGLKINRLLGLGVGVGIENFTPGNDDVTTYPVFGEARGYFSRNNVTPFYALAAGWGFADDHDERTRQWKGGWMAQGQIGYRIGNHLTIHIGLRFQRKRLTWENTWGGSRGIDEILQKRFETGVGILL